MTDYLNSLIEKNESHQEGIQPRPLSRFEPFLAVSAFPAFSGMVQEREAQQFISEPPLQVEPLQSPNETLSEKKMPQNFTLPLEDSRFEEADIPSPRRTEPNPDSSLLQSDWGGLDSNLRLPPESRPQPYRGRLDLTAMMPSESRSQAAKNDKSVELSLHTPPNASSPSTMPDAQPEISQYQTLKPIRNSDTSPLRANSLYPDSHPREGIFFLERIVEQTILPSAKALVQNPVPESLPRDLPADRPVVHELHPIIPRLPDLPSRSLLPEPSRTVNVTIGRIEVRATPAPVMPRKSSSTPALMSLDEYLQSRVKGERQ